MKKETITSESPSFLEKVKEIIEYKDLFLALAYKDLMIKYIQTYLGIVWALIQPLATILIFSFVFGKIMKTDTQGIPYPLFVTLGMCSWNYFSVVMQQSGASIITSSSMIQKIYFPRLILPLSKAFVGLADYLVGLMFIIGAMVYYQFLPSFQIVYYPFIFLWLVITSLGTGIWLSSLTVKFRDFQYVLPFMVQFGLYATPVGYSLPKTDSFYQILFYLNPLTGILEMSRWSILGIGSPSVYCLLSIFSSLFLFITSIVYFGKTEAKMSDLL